MRRALQLLATTGFALLVAHVADAHGDPFSAKSDPAITRKATTLQDGIGRVHQKVSTSSEEAQSFYDQGLAHLHSYRWVEAARSFHQALRHDPQLAMAKIGLARALEGMKDEAAADAALAEARELLDGASAHEKLHVEAYAAKRRALAAPPDERATAAEAHRQALDALLASDESDAEAWLLRGNASEGPWGRGQGGDETSIPFYEGALRAAPGHFAAHHYLAHSYENLDRADEAVRHAETYAKSCPNVPHARHMYAHTLPRVGRWPDAVRELEAANRLEEEFAAREGLDPSHDWHRVHNLTVLGLAYLRVGRDEEAERTLARAFATPIPDPLVQSWHSTWPEFLLLQNRPGEALEAARTLAGRPSPLLEVIGTALEGEALLDQGKRDQAAAASAETRKRIERLQAETASHPHGEAIVWVATEYANVLDARRALHADPDAQWLAFVGQVADQIAADPTFDGWGVGWLRLRRLTRDAQRTGHDDLARRLQKHLGHPPEPPDAK